MYGTQFYTDPSRESDPYALPNAEVFYMRECDAIEENGERSVSPAGWYWWLCFPGCLPDSDPIGPFDTQAEAIADAQKE